MQHVRFDPKLFLIVVAKVLMLTLAVQKSAHELHNVAFMSSPQLPNKEHHMVQ